MIRYFGGSLAIVGPRHVPIGYFAPDYLLAGFTIGQITKLR